MSEDLPTVRLVIELDEEALAAVDEHLSQGHETLPLDVHVSVLEVRDAAGDLVTEFDVICPTAIEGVRNMRIYVRSPSPHTRED